MKLHSTCKNPLSEGFPEGSQGAHMGGLLKLLFCKPSLVLIIPLKQIIFIIGFKPGCLITQMKQPGLSSSVWKMKNYRCIKSIIEAPLIFPAPFQWRFYLAGCDGFYTVQHLALCWWAERIWFHLLLELYARSTAVHSIPFLPSTSSYYQLRVTNSVDWKLWVVFVFVCYVLFLRYLERKSRRGS